MKAILTSLALVLMAGAAPAQDKPDTEKRLADLERKLDTLQKEKEAPKARLASGAEEERVLAPVGLTAFYDNGYLVGTSFDGAFKYWLDGRINLDAAWYEGAKNRLPDGAEVRRARIGVKATLFNDWLSEIDLDFTDNAVEIKDLWVGYAGFENSVIRVGNHKAPFGMETLTSSKYMWFMERAYIDSWAPDRLLGVSYSHWGRHWQASGGIFGQEAGASWNDKDTLTGTGAGTQQGWGATARASFAPINEKGRVLHFGLAANRRRPDAAKMATSGSDLPDRLNASKIVKFDSRPETHVSRAKFISTGDIKYVDYWQQLGLEAAGVFGPFSYLAEYQTTDVKRTNPALPSYKFSGYSAAVSWFLTGESRPYSVSEGEFGRLIPRGRHGAWEIALRFSSMDLNDNLGDPVSANQMKGGSAKNITLGINWHINANHKLMLNISKVDNDQYAKPNKEYAPIPTGTSTTQTPVLGDDFKVIQLRYQLAF